jgi:hypothetical protein
LLFFTIVVKAKAAGRVGKIAGKAVAFQEHPFRHLLSPRLHHAANGAKWHSCLAQMGG